jgi:N-acyl homoserine lactone hydrolase
MTRVRLRRLAHLWLTCGLVLPMLGCDTELRVPYIPPQLSNWPRPYRGVADLKLHAFTTGYLSVPEAAVLKGGSLTRTMELPVLAFVVEHPHQGLVLYGTGLDPRMAQSSQRPERLLAFGPEPYAAPGSDLETQMKHAGLDASTVRSVILPSLRSRHTGCVERFGTAQVVVASSEKHAAGTPSPQVDDVRTWKEIDFSTAAPLGTFAAHIDLFGDGTLLLIDAAGATPGTMALLVRLRERPVLLTGDLISTPEQLRHVIRPAAADDMPKWWDHAWRLKRFQELAPELVVVPGHDTTALTAAALRSVRVHDPLPVAAPQRPTPTLSPLQRVMPRPM